MTLLDLKLICSYQVDVYMYMYSVFSYNLQFFLSHLYSLPISHHISMSGSLQPVRFGPDSAATSCSSSWVVTSLVLLRTISLCNRHVSTSGLHWNIAWTCFNSVARALILLITSFLEKLYQKPHYSQPNQTEYIHPYSVLWWFYTVIEYCVDDAAH